MIDEKYLITMEALSEGYELICIHTESTGPHEGRFIVGETYVVSYLRAEERQYQVQDEIGSYVGPSHADLMSTVWSNISWDNGASWVEFAPRAAFTEEDLFAVKLGGMESILGERT